MQTPRILIYSHDSFGLGHLRRATTLARAFAGMPSRPSILVVTGSPRPGLFSLPYGVDYVRLPAITKDQSGRYVPRDLARPLEDVVAVRSALVRSVVASYRPTHVLVDHSPVGVCGELLPALEDLRSQRPGVSVTIGLRDVLDSPARARLELDAPALRGALEDLYDGLIVYGDPLILDWQKEYGLSGEIASRTHYAGVVTPQPAAQRPSIALMRRSRRQRIPHVLVTSGGGQDGFALHESVLMGLASGLAPRGVRTTVVTGPLLPGAAARRLSGLVRGVKRIRLVDCLPDMDAEVKRADVVLCMGGYNSVYEALAAGKRPLIFPRSFPREEQVERARRLARLGLVDVVEPADIAEPARLWSRIGAALADEPPAPPPFALDGAQRCARFLLNEPRTDATVPARPVRERPGNRPLVNTPLLLLEAR